MCKIINITDSDTDRDILVSSDHGTSWNSNNQRKSNRVNVSRILISNTGTTQSTISIYIYQIASQNAEYHLVKNLDIPTSVTFVWDEPITFNNATHKLRLSNSVLSGTPGLTVIID